MKKKDKPEKKLISDINYINDILINTTEIVDKLTKKKDKIKTKDEGEEKKEEGEEKKEEGEEKKEEGEEKKEKGEEKKEKGEEKKENNFYMKLPSMISIGISETEFNNTQSLNTTFTDLKHSDYNAAPGFFEEGTRCLNWLSSNGVTLISSLESTDNNEMYIDFTSSEIIEMENNKEELSANARKFLYVTKNGKREAENWIKIPDITIFENNKLLDYSNFRKQITDNGMTFKHEDTIITPGFRKYIYKNFICRRGELIEGTSNTYLYLENNIEEKTLKFMLL